MMMRAGFRSPEATLAIQGMRLLTPIALVIPGADYGNLPQQSVFRFAGRDHPGLHASGVVAFPGIKSVSALRVALPDGLDLLVVCVEVGFGLDQALLRVAQELRIVHSD